MLPGIALPGFVARLALAGDGVETPGFFAGLYVVRGDEASNAVLASGRTDDHFVLDHQRSVRKRIARGRFSDCHVPDRLPAFRVQGNQMRIDGAHEQCVAQYREPAIYLPATGTRGARRQVSIRPENAPGHRIQRNHVIRRLHGVQDAVHHQRRGLVFFERPRLEHPLQFQVLYVLGRDLIQRRIALAHGCAGVGQPVLRLAAGGQNPVEGYLAPQASGRTCSQAKDRQSCSRHSTKPFR